MTIPPGLLYLAWTEQFDQWFAAPGSLLMTARVDCPFYFETQFEGQRHPHYGRFVKLVPDELIELTWVTGDPGTKGAETVVTIEFAALAGGTRVTLSHAGFADEESRNRHEDAWPQVLNQLERHLANVGN